MFNSIKDILGNLPSYNDENGYRVDPPSELVVSNADKFMNSLPGYYRKILDPENVTASAHGTIVIDWYRSKNFVSVEIGQTKIGFFTEMPDGSNPQSAGTPLTEEANPMIVKCLNMLYGRQDTVESQKISPL